jgi:hypothetical protein
MAPPLAADSNVRSNCGDTGYREHGKGAKMPRRVNGGWMTTTPTRVTAVNVQRLGRVVWYGRGLRQSRAASLQTQRAHTR